MMIMTTEIMTMTKTWVSDCDKSDNGDSDDNDDDDDTVQQVINFPNQTDYFYWS